MPNEEEQKIRRWVESLEDRIRDLEKAPDERKMPDLKSYEDVKFFPLLKLDKLQDLRQLGRTSISVDLSGSAVTLVALHSEQPITLVRAYFLYTEASSADAGITVEVGKESDRDYYFTGTTEVSKAIWYTKELTLLKTDVSPGDTVTFYSPGGKTGTGEIMLIIEYKLTLI